MKLQSLKVVYICPDHNEYYNKRKEHMDQLLKNIGFKEIVHYKSSTEKYPLCLTNATIDILEQNIDEPVLILEDDIEYTGIDTFEFDDFSIDAIFFGISRCGAHPTENRDDGWAKYTHYNDTQVRIVSMLSTHAKLYISARYKKAVIEHLKKIRDLSFWTDVAISQLQSKFKLLANKKPSFYQSAKFNSCDHVERCTKIEF